MGPPFHRVRINAARYILNKMQVNLRLLPLSIMVSSSLLRIHTLGANSRLLFRRGYASAPAGSLRKTGLYDFHVEHGAKMVPFAGYSMPLSYADVGQGELFSRLASEKGLTSSIVASHNHVRTSAGLFDVGHMVQSKYALMLFPALMTYID